MDFENMDYEQFMPIIIVVIVVGVLIFGASNVTKFVDTAKKTVIEKTAEVQAVKNSLPIPVK